jgi:hypothetical protein
MFKVKTPTEMLNELKSINTFIKSDDEIKDFPRTLKPLELIPNTKVHFDTLLDYKEDVKDVEFNLLLKLTRMENKLEDIEKLLKSVKLE